MFNRFKSEFLNDYMWHQIMLRIYLELSKPFTPILQVIGIRDSFFSNFQLVTANTGFENVTLVFT